MKIVCLFLLLNLFCMAEWTSVDYNALIDTRNNTANTVNALIEHKDGYYSQTNDRLMGWGDYYRLSYKSQREISDAKTYSYRKVDGYDTLILDETDPFSQNNETMFSQNDHIRDNSDEYRNYIYSSMSERPNVESLEMPEGAFLNNPQKGDSMYKMITPLDNSNLGINAIKNSAQTEGVRTSISNAQTQFTGIFNENTYAQSVINWDLSSLGQIFVDKRIMTVNPWQNLKGQFHLVPTQNDYIYPVWYNHIRKESQTGHAFRLCIQCVVYGFILVYVVNDIMSIVNA